jgi:hypothetical protein
MRRRPLAPLLLSQPSRFAGWPQNAARMMLAALAALLLAALVAMGTPNPDVGAPSDGMSDAVLYGTIVDNVRHGGDYYAVAADALRSGSYPLRPFVAFRLPTLAVVSGAMPAFVVTVLLWVLTVAVALAWYARLAPALARTPARVAAMVLLLAGIAAASAPELAIFHELWAGLLIALSLALHRPAHRSDRWIEPVAIGLAAALIRETAALYLVVMLVLAARDGARREAIGWAAALVVLAVILGFHAQAVAEVVRPLDPASPGWGALLGLGFAIRATILSSALQFVPLWLAAPSLVLALAGWSAWREPIAVRVQVTIAAYAMVLAIVARADNYYWALLIAPLSVVGLIFAVDALRDLIAAARDGRRITVTRVVR